MSHKSRTAALKELSRHYRDVRITIVNELTDLEALVARRPDLVFLGAHMIKPSSGSGGESIWLSEYFDEHDIAYTGSDKQARFYERNKPLAKARIASAGLATSNSFVVDRHTTGQSIEHDLTYPLFVKPTNSGGGTGIDKDSYIENHGQLMTKVKSIAINHHANSLVEEYLPGREFSVAIIIDELSQNYIGMPIELIAKADSKGISMLSEQVKKYDTEVRVKVADKDLATNITAIALNIFKALGARDYGRIDIRLDQTGQPNFLEANLIPSLIEGYGSFPRACLLNNDMSYSQVIQLIVRLGLKRSISSSKLPIWPKVDNVLPAKI